MKDHPLPAGLQVVLAGTRFPENIGMAARACANMGVATLVLAAPEWWDKEKAWPLATAQGEEILKNVRIESDLGSAVKESALVIGTTARIGGWRREIITPAQAAKEARAALLGGGHVSIVFGPEDRGLSNEDIQLCGRLVRIPTARAASLNVAQAALLMLYECRLAMLERTNSNVAPGASHKHSPRFATQAEMSLLLEHLRALLLGIDFLHGDNPDYFMQPLRRLLGRGRLRRHEFDLLMGICRQMRHALEKNLD